MQRTFVPMALLFVLLLVLSACEDGAFSSTGTSTPIPATPDAANEVSDTDAVTGTESISATGALTEETPVTVGEVLTDDLTVSDLLTPTVTAKAPITGSISITGTNAATATAPVTQSTSATGEFQLGGILGAELLASVTMSEIDAVDQSFYPSSNFVAAAYPVDIYRVHYQTSNELGEPVDAQTDLFIPRVGERAELPMWVYAPGTTGIGDNCAPSMEAELGRAWGGYRIHMLSYAAQGFIGVLPDGQNYDNPNRPHEYFIAELEARVVLDAARAAYNFYALPIARELEAQPTNALFIGGYSNGGHMAFAAKDFAADYAPELPLRGVISHGATTNVEILMQEAPLFTPYLIYSYRYYFGSDVITPQQVFADQWLPTFDEDVNEKCVDEIFAYYTFDPQLMYNQQFYDVLYNGQLASRYPVFKAVLDANYAGTFGGFDVPVVFFQGTADYTVTPPSQERFAYHLCQNGQPVTYQELPAIQHVQTRQNSLLATMEWMRNIVAGETPRNDCAEILQP